MCFVCVFVFCVLFRLLMKLYSSKQLVNIYRILDSCFIFMVRCVLTLTVIFEYLLCIPLVLGFNLTLSFSFFR